MCDQVDQSRAQSEYVELGQNMRHFSNMRFAQLTLYFALNAGLLTVAFGTTPQLPEPVRMAAKITGVVGTLAFATMEERAADYWHHFRKRAVVLEEALTFRQYGTRPLAKYLSATNATRFLFVVGLVLWGLSFFVKS